MEEAEWQAAGRRPEEQGAPSAGPSWPRCGDSPAASRRPAEMEDVHPLAPSRRRSGSHRRLHLVAGTLGLVALVVLTVHVGRGQQRDAPAGRRTAARPVVLQEEGGSQAPPPGLGEEEAQLKEEDEKFCEEFKGFLYNQCMEKREKDRNAPKYWTANEVRNGLWKTEKALADLEIRQYKHGKERDALHKEHERKLNKFKQRMEVALTLIHEIQNEMGTRHSQLVGRLKADILSTQARLKQYLDEGVDHLHGKVSILEEREEALTKRLLEMVQAQYEMLDKEAEEVHAKEMAKDQNIHAFIEGVEAAQQAGDLRIEAAINATREKFEALKAREAEHYSGLNTKKDAQAQKQARDVVTATTKIDTDVAALRANLTATLTADKADIRGKLKAGWTEANQSLAQLALDAEAAASAIDSRLAVQSAAQAANNAEQDQLIAALEDDLHVFNLTVFDEIVTMEGNASRFEQALAAAEATIRNEQQAQKAAILSHINAAIAQVEEVHRNDKSKMEADVAWMKPKADKVARELQEAIAAIEKQREEDLALLTGKLAANISHVNATYQLQHAEEQGKAYAAVQALASALGRRRDDLSAEDDERTKALADRMSDYKTNADENNEEQGARLAALRANFTAEAARRVKELADLDTRAEAVRAAMEAARARLLTAHAADMAAAKQTLSTTLDGLITHITELLQQEVATTDGTITGDLHTQTRALNRLDVRITDEDQQLNASEREMRVMFEESTNRTETRISADMARLVADRARWDANTKLGANWHAWLDSNITSEFARLDAERVSILASVKWDLASSLASVSARVAAELAAIEHRQGARLTGDKQAIVSLLSTLANLQDQLDENATMQVEQLQSVQAVRDAAHSRVVASLESGMGKDKDKIQDEIHEFNATFQEAASRNAAAQADVKRDMVRDEREVRTGFKMSLEDMRARLNSMIARSNITELEDLEESVREVMMKASKLGWRLGAQGADLRALLESVTEEQQNLFNEEGARLQQIREEEVRAYHAHTQELSVLQSRVGNEEAQLSDEELKLHQDLLSWDASARDAVPPAVEAMEDRLDSKLRAQGTEYKGALQTKVESQLARAQTQRENEQARLAELASKLEAAKAVLDGHMPIQTALVDGAETTITNKTAAIKRVLDAVEPILTALETRLATVYDSIRSQHAAAQAKVNAEVRKGIADLGDTGLGEVAKEKVLLEALVAENMAEPEKGLTLLQAKLNGLDTDFRNELSAEKQLHGNLHDAVRVHLASMERELRESNTNLTSYVTGLKEDLDNWKAESTRALSKLELKQGDDKTSFLRSLAATKRDVRGALRQLRRKFGAALADLTSKIATAQTTLQQAHQQLKATQARDKTTIRRDVRRGVTSLQNSASSKLTARGNEEKKNIQTIINAKSKLVAELTRSTNKLVAALRTRVQLAVRTEAQDNQDQEKQLTSNDAIMQRWVRNSEAGETSLESRLDRIEERVKRRQERAEADQNIMVAQLASKLMRQVAWLNSTFAASNSRMVSAVQGSLGQEMAKLQKKLGAVRGKTLKRLTQQKAALEALDKGQASAIEALKNQLAALQVRLKRVEDYSRGRTSLLVQDTKDAEKNLRERLKRMMEERKEQTQRIKTDTDQTYERLQDDWTQRVETQRQWLTRSLDTQAAGVERRLSTLSTQLANKITGLETRLVRLSTTNDRRQDTLKRRIALETSRRGEVEELEAQVRDRLRASKASMASFNVDMSQLEENTKTEVGELERKIDLNQGITTSTDELLRTLRALKRDVTTLRTQENGRDRELRGRMRSSKTKADSTESYLQSQLRNLERMLEHDSNERRRGRAQTQAKAQAYDMRMDRYRADLTRINATWNAMDAAEMRNEAVANGEVQGNFGAPPPAPDTVVGSDDKSRLNAWCARYRDKAAGYDLAKQKNVLEKCYEQDCELSLEGGNTNRPDRPGCRYVDGNGFCYAMGAGQVWCRDNAISPVCHDGGPRWAAPPLGIAPVGGSQWEPKSKAAADGKTLQCSCMKNCGCTSSKCYCTSGDATPVGEGVAAYESRLSRPIVISSSKAGKCDCSCVAV